MGQSASALIDELHTAAMLPDDIGLHRKLKALKTTMVVANKPTIACEVVEQGGLQPLAKCYNSSHPSVRVEAARALAALAVQPVNQVEMGHPDVLPLLMPALLTGEAEFKEHAMAVMAQLAIPEENKLKLVHEGCLTAVIDECTSPNIPLRLHALKALAHLVEQPLISVMAAQRGALKALLRAARSDSADVKLGTLRALVGIANVGDNLSLVVKSGTPIYLLSCTYCKPDMQLNVARAFENFLDQVFQGTHYMSEEEAKMVFETCGLEVNRERIKASDALDMGAVDTKNMNAFELLPELVRRTKKLVSCDRASIFLLTEDKTELTTILAENIPPICVPADSTSIAGESVTRANIINLARADTHPSFNKEVDKRTGYKTRSMLVMPIRASQGEAHPIGVVQCINKLGKIDLSAGDASSEEGLMKMMPTFSADDESALSELCRQIAPIIENVRVEKGGVVASKGLTDDWISNVSLMSKAPTEEIIRKVLNKTRDIVSADRASLFLVDRRKKELWSKIADNTPEIRVKMGAGIVGAVATTGEPLNVPDAYRDARFNKKIDMATGYRTRQILCLPIKNQRSQVVGVVQCINKKRGGHAFTMDDEERLNELCFQCASVLELRALEAATANNKGNAAAAAAAAEGEEAAGEEMAATGDGIAALLHLIQSPRMDVQLHAVNALGYACQNEANRTRVALLGGVPLLLELTTPFPWRNPELLLRASRALGHLTLSEDAQREAATQGGWKSLLLLAKSRDARAHFDSLRCLANLAAYEPLREPLLNTGALPMALSFFRNSDVDLQSQAVRLLGSLSLCCADGAHNAEAHKIKFTQADVVEKLGRASTIALGSGGRGTEALPNLCFCFGKLSLLPEYQAWLFGADGVVVLQGFASYTGAQRQSVRVQLTQTIAHCLRLRNNQRIILSMLQSKDPTDPAYQSQSTAQQRLSMLQEKDALATGDQVRKLMDRLLLTKPWDAQVLLHYTAALELLTRERSNHEYLLQKPYVQQLVLLSTQLKGEGLALALRGLRHLAQFGVIDGVRQVLLRLKVLPALYILCKHPEQQLEGLKKGFQAQVEICRLMAALAGETAVANTVATYRGPPGADSDVLLLEAFGNLFESPSSHVLVEASAALEVFAPHHKVAICHAKLVARLIALSHSDDIEVSVAGGKVLRALSMS